MKYLQNYLGIDLINLKKCFYWFGTKVDIFRFLSGQKLFISKGRQKKTKYKKTKKQKTDKREHTLILLLKPTTALSTKTDMSDIMGGANL